MSRVQAGERWAILSSGNGKWYLADIAQRDEDGNPLQIESPALHAAIVGHVITCDRAYRYFEQIQPEFSASKLKGWLTVRLACAPIQAQGDTRVTLLVTDLEEFDLTNDADRAIVDGLLEMAEQNRAGQRIAANLDPAGKIVSPGAFRNPADGQRGSRRSS